MKRILLFLLVSAFALGSFADRNTPMKRREMMPLMAGPDIKKSEWKGFERHDFIYNKRKTIVVMPKTAAKGNPWVWRPAFFGAFAQADMELLDKGFHVVFYDVTHEYGCPNSIKDGDKFYDFITDKYSLSKKVTLEGLSRGGYYSLQWAIAYPERVACMYLDNPVCDIFSWPGKGREKLWKGFLDKWGLKDATPKTFKKNPLDNLKALAEAKVPMLLVCGDSDRTVPFKDNGLLLRERYVKLGGTAELIIKKGVDHHPHCLDKPEPIVDFIVSHQPDYQAGQYLNIRGSLGNSFLRFEKERKGCVAFLGGSITEMSGWRKMVQRQLKQRFPFTEFKFIDVGIGSTGTTPHAFRLDNDVLSKGPVDLLFVEGAVNDDTNKFNERDQIRGMEGIVRHVWNVNPNTDIIMLHFVYAPFLPIYKEGKTPGVIVNHDRVADYYGIPSIDCAKEIAARIENGEFTWKDFGGTHPKPFGHKFYAADIRTMWDKMWNEKGTDKPKAHKIPSRQMDEYSYTAGRFMPLESAKIEKGWEIRDTWKPDTAVNTRRGFVNVPMLYSNTPGASFSFGFKGKAVGLFMACGPKSGIIEYSIDGKPYKQLDTFTSWSRRAYLPWLWVLEAELETNVTHRVNIRLTDRKNRKSNGTECVIRNIVINE